MADLPRRRAGLSVRTRLALSYASFLMLAGGLLLAVVWMFLLRYVPDTQIPSRTGFVPNRSDLLTAFAPPAAAAMGFLLVFGLVGGWILAGWMVAPLERIGRAARAAADGSLSHRLRLPGRRDEFREVADTFDLMLERLESQMALQRRFAANASHELRTPLATTQTMLEVARASGTTPDPDLLADLHTVNARAIAVTEALLLLSRAEAGAFEQEPVDLSLLAEDAVEQLLDTAERRGVQVEVTGGTAWTPGSPTLLLQLVTNLVQNAIVHNLPAAGTVVVSTREESTGEGSDSAARGSRPGASLLVVENTGPVLAEDLVGTLSEPFRRGAGRRRQSTDDHVGAGLGLALAHSIVTAHAGTLELTPRADGGLTVEVRLPGIVPPAPLMTVPAPPGPPSTTPPRTEPPAP